MPYSASNPRQSIEGPPGNSLDHNEASLGAGEAVVAAAMCAPPPADDGAPQHSAAAAVAAAPDADDIPYPMPWAVCIRGAGEAKTSSSSTTRQGDDDTRRRALPSVIDVCLPMPSVLRLAAEGGTLVAALSWSHHDNPPAAATASWEAQPSPSSQQASGGSSSFPAAAGGKAAVGGGSSSSDQQAATCSTAAAFASGYHRAAGRHVALPLRLPPLSQLQATAPPLLLLQLYSRRGGAPGDPPPADKLIAVLPIILLPSAPACCEVLGLIANPTTGIPVGASASPQLPSTSAPTAAPALPMGRAFAGHVAPLLWDLSQAMSGPQRVGAASAGSTSDTLQAAAVAGNSGGGSSTTHQSQMAAYALEVERLLVLLLSRDMTHTAKHLVAAAERAGVAFANRHLLMGLPPPPDNLRGRLPLRPLADPGAVLYYGRSSSYDSAADTPAAAAVGPELPGFTTPTPMAPPAAPPLLVQGGRMDPEEGLPRGDDGVGGDVGSTATAGPRHAPVVPAVPAVPRPDAEQALPAAAAAAACGSIRAAAVQATAWLARRGVAAAATAAWQTGSPPEHARRTTGAVASTSAGEPAASSSPSSAVWPVEEGETVAPGAAGGGAAGGSASSRGDILGPLGLRPLLSACLSGFHIASDEADFLLFKAASIRPAVLLLLLLELLTTPTLLLLNGPSPNFLGSKKLCLLAFCVASLAPLLVPLPSITAGSMAVRSRGALATWLARQRSALTLLAQMSETALVLFARTSPAQGLHQLVAALGAHPLTCITYGQFVKTALLQLNPKTATACTLLRLLQYLAAFSMAAGRPTPALQKRAPSDLAAGPLPGSRWPLPVVPGWVAALLVAASIVGLLATFAGDAALRLAWARRSDGIGGTRRGTERTGMAPSGSGSQGHPGDNSPKAE